MVDRRHGGSFYTEYFKAVRELGQEEVDRRMRAGDMKRLERLRSLSRSRVDWTVNASERKQT